MDKRIAKEILIKSHNAQEILFSIFDKYLREKIKEDMDRSDIEGKIYKGIFSSYHTIMNSIQDEIFKEYPNIQKEFEDYIENKILDKK